MFLPGSKPGHYHAYGWRRSKPDHRDRFLLLRPGAGLPVAVDLTPKCPPVYDQESLGSCTANALAGLIEFDRMKQGLADFTPSRLFVYYNERWIEGDIPWDAGAEMRDGLKAVANWGYPSESYWPYNIGWFSLRPPARVYRDAIANRIQNYAAVPQTRGAIQAVLASGIPIVFGFTCYESLESQQTAATGDVPMPSTGESVIGGHAVMLVGYDDATQKYRFRNSWGAGWGKYGYGTLPYEYVENPQLAADFWTINMV